MLYKAREKNTNVFDDYSSMVSEAKYKSVHGEGDKILTPKLMPQKLAIAFAQVKEGNTSENLLNKICQFIYSSYQAK